MKQYSIQQHRDTYVNWLCEMGADYFLTFNFNYTTNYEGARTKLRHFFAEVDRYFLGPGWMRLKEDRSDMVLVCENVTTNFHIHGLGYLPSKAKGHLLEIQESLAESWSRQVPGGSIDLQIVYDLYGAASYVCKQLTSREQFEKLMHTREFWP